MMSENIFLRLAAVKTGRGAVSHVPSEIANAESRLKCELVEFFG
jgi:hypothetical protein